MAETPEEMAARRGYKTMSLMYPSQKYDGPVRVLSWSPVARAYDDHFFPDGFDPDLSGAQKNDR